MTTSRSSARPFMRSTRPSRLKPTSRVFKPSNTCSISFGCPPEHILHVSSSLRYDLMSAHDLRFGTRAFVNRGHGPGNAAYGYTEIADIGGLPGLVGL